MLENIFFKRSKINFLNFVPIGICLGFSLYFIVIEASVFYNTKPIVIYSFGLYFFTFTFNYRALRNLNIWLIWFGLSLLQILIYYQNELENTDFTAIRGLRNFWIFLIVFQIFRWISIKFQKEEFITLSRSKWDILDNRRITILDMLIYVLGIFFIFILQII